jgi:hypothetical protein
MRKHSTGANTGWANDESAQATMEWVLLLGMIIVPSSALIFEIMISVGWFYSISSWVISLPFP